MQCCDQGTNCDEELVVTIQINGKKVDTMRVPAAICREPLKMLALENETVVKFLAGREEKDIILDAKKAVNIII